MIATAALRWLPLRAGWTCFLRPAAACLVLLAGSALAQTSPPPPAAANVFSLVEIAGTVEFRAAGRTNWVAGKLNQSLVVGDWLRTGPRSRLAVAKQEVAQWKNFDYLVESTTKAEDLRRMLEIIAAEKMRVARSQAPEF